MAEATFAEELRPREQHQALAERSLRLSRRAVLGVAATALFAPAVRSQSQLREISIPITSTSFATASVRAAEILGCFSRHGLNAKFPLMDTGSNVTAALVSGSTQVALGGAGEQVAAAARGQPIVALTNTYWGLASTLVLASEIAQKTGVSTSAPIQDRLKALDGILVAFPSATSTYTNSFRGAAEATGAKIRSTYMGQPAMVAALESGVVQGYSAGAPFWGDQVKRGKAVVWISGPKGELPRKNTPASITSFHTMRPFAEANSSLMKQILDSYRDYSNILEQSPDRVRGALAKIYPEIDPATLDLLFEAEHKGWIMRDVSLDDVKQDIAFMVASGISLPGIEKVDPVSLLYRPR